jgi:hypothetical protein
MEAWFLGTIPERGTWVTSAQRSIPIESHSETDTLLSGVGVKSVKDMYFDLRTLRQFYKPRRMILSRMSKKNRDATCHIS